MIFFIHFCEMALNVIIMYILVLIWQFLNSLLALTNTGVAGGDLIGQNKTQSWADWFISVVIGGDDAESSC